MKPVQYYSTNRKSPAAGFREALKRGLAPDGGLYMPDSIPELDLNTISALRGKDIKSAGRLFLSPWLSAETGREAFDALIDDALNFDAPLVKLKDNLYVLELFHGPTFAFKDFAARTMSRLMAQLLRDQEGELHVLTATSGDTGAAVADGFLGVPGIKVWVFYPSGKVSPLQEKQFTSLGQNITAIEVNGSFDDCQHLVKQAFRDHELAEHRSLTSANSINIGRLLPQMVYYARGWAQLPENSAAPVFCVPSGNFGNLTAGLLAQRMGLPAAHFIAGVNSNRTFFNYWKKGSYEAQPSVRTVSNAMDVGDPSNFSRITELFEHDHARLSENITPYWFDDRRTIDAIHEVFETYGYMMDPHTAVGYLAMKHWRQETGDKRPGILLSTAHPAKFMDVIPEKLHEHIRMPEAFKKLANREKQSIPIEADYKQLFSVLMR